MGDGVTSETELVISIADSEAGTTQGQLILDDVEYNRTRENDSKHGIGHEDPQAMQYGNKEYSLSATAILNGSAADMILAAEGQSILTGTLRTPNLEVDVGKLDWNDVTLSASDGGDVTVDVSFDARQATERERA